MIEEARAGNPRSLRRRERPLSAGVGLQPLIIPVRGFCMLGAALPTSWAAPFLRTMEKASARILFQVRERRHPSRSRAG